MFTVHCSIVILLIPLTLQPVFRLYLYRFELLQPYETRFGTPRFGDIFSLGIVHFHFRGISRLRKICGQLCSLDENGFVQFSLLSSIPHDDVRPSVLGHMKPEIVRRCHLEGQFIVVATIAANEHFAPFELGRTKTFLSNILSGMLRLLTVGGWNGGMFASG